MTSKTDPDALWREFHERLLAFVRRRIDHDADAEDLLQDVFLRIHASADRQSSRIENLSGWLYQITRNAITDYYRSRASAARARLELEDAESTNARDTTKDEGQARGELAACLRPLVEQLPELYGEAVSLTDLGELSQADAARRLGVSASGMKSRVQRGRAKLEALVLDCCDVELDSRRGVTDYQRRVPGSKDGSDEDEPCC